MSTDMDIVNRIRRSIEYYCEEDISVGELLNMVICVLAEGERFELIETIATMLPKSVDPELLCLVERILSPGAEYTPFVIGVRTPEAAEAWRQRMRPACRKVATLLRKYLANQSP